MGPPGVRASFRYDKIVLLGRQGRANARLGTNVKALHGSPLPLPAQTPVLQIPTTTLKLT
jgi:hypothetical protein